MSVDLVAELPSPVRDWAHTVIGTRIAAPEGRSDAPTDTGPAPARAYAREPERGRQKR